MPADTIAFWLKPFGFFDRNPALDAPRTTSACSTGHGDGGSCGCDHD